MSEEPKATRTRELTTKKLVIWNLCVFAPCLLLILSLLSDSKGNFGNAFVLLLLAPTALVLLGIDIYILYTKYFSKKA